MNFKLVLALALTFVLWACSRNPAEWDSTKIESWIEKNWDLATITVTENTDGSFSGTGTDQYGKAYIFKIEQKPGTKELWCTQYDEGGSVVVARAIRKF